MAIFKCKHTGCQYEWTDAATVEVMRKHTEYKEVLPVTPVKEAPKAKKVPE